MKKLIKLNEIKIFNLSFLAILIIICFSGLLYSGTTGRIVGKVVDAQTNEPIVGANVLIEGTYLGAAAGVDGFYSINNVPPGKYRLIASAVGYQKTIIENVLVKIDLTTRVDIKMMSSVIQLDKEVVVTSERPLVQKDLTSTSVTISN